eukprot:GEMP01055209.1.p1 GENE.GEMP01055209.1~~GEMP01055209.1.p1  ORF type:complete len:358 (+),score=108.69 GEMP01055209.1:26-1099(+)
MGDSTFLTSIKVTDGCTAAKQKQREELISSIGSAGTKILSLHKDLQQVADELDQRVEYLLGNNEKDFFLAYKTHMYQVQKEFKVLKSKADEEETKTRRDARIGSLETELGWFTNESLRLDNLCKKYKQQVDKWKQRATGLDDDRRFLENQIRMAKKQNRVLRNAVEHAANLPVKAIDGTFAWDERDHAQAERKLEVDEAPEPLSKDLTLRYCQTIKSLQHQLQAEKRQGAKIRESRKLVGDIGRLEQYFLLCIQQVKENIFDRRQQILYGNSLTAPNATKIVNAAAANVSVSGQGGMRGFCKSKVLVQDLDDITMDMFTAADRRRVIELLFMDKEIQSLIHHKVLPQKIREVEGEMS